jgi:glucose-6-phosphate 1-dehydrogenase
MAEHTKGLLHHHSEQIDIIDVVDDKVTTHVCIGNMIEHQSINHHTMVANAARVVLCWNSHDPLVKALKAMRDAMASYQYGNSSPDLAIEMCSMADRVLKESQ